MGIGIKERRYHLLCVAAIDILIICFIIPPTNGSAPSSSHFLFPLRGGSSSSSAAVPEEAAQHGSSIDVCEELIDGDDDPFWIEEVPSKRDIDAWIQRYESPFAPDAWTSENKKTKKWIRKQGQSLDSLYRQRRLYWQGRMDDPGFTWFPDSFWDQMKEQQPRMMTIHPMRTDVWTVSMRWKGRLEGRRFGGAKNMYFEFHPNGYVRSVQVDDSDDNENWPDLITTSSQNSTTGFDDEEDADSLLYMLKKRFQNVISLKKPHDQLEHSADPEMIDCADRSTRLKTIAIGTWELLPWGVEFDLVDATCNADTVINYWHGTADIHLNPFGDQPKLIQGQLVRHTMRVANLQPREADYENEEDFEDTLYAFHRNHNDRPRRSAIRAVVGTFHAVGSGKEMADWSYQEKNRGIGLSKAIQADEELR